VADNRSGVEHSIFRLIKWGRHATRVWPGTWVRPLYDNSVFREHERLRRSKWSILLSEGVAHLA